MLNEPTAAELAYGIDQLDSEQTVLVFDLGGGTFYITIMKVTESKIEMIATKGDHRHVMIPKMTAIPCEKKGVFKSQRRL